PAPVAASRVRRAPAWRPGTAALPIIHARREGQRITAGVETGIRFHAVDATATHPALLSRGVRLGEVLRWPGGPATFKAFDPDGNRCEIVECMSGRYRSWRAPRRHL